MTKNLHKSVTNSNLEWSIFLSVLYHCDIQYVVWICVRHKKAGPLDKLCCNKDLKIKDFSQLSKDSKSRFWKLDFILCFHRSGSSFKLNPVKIWWSVYLNYREGSIRCILASDYLFRSNRVFIWASMKYVGKRNFRM